MATLGQCYYRLCTHGTGHRLAAATLRALRRLGMSRDFRMPLDCLGLPHPAVAELMRLWRRMHWSSGDGMMPGPELLTIYRLACRNRVDGDFVELGAWKGLTTCYLAAACRVRGRGRVYAVDTFRGTRENNTLYPSVARCGGETLSSFQETVERAGVDDLVTPCVGFTTEVVRTYPGRPIALLLIDADHSYRGVQGDFEAWFPLVAEGGLVIFHDYAMAEVRACIEGEIRSRTDLRPEPGNVLPNIFAVTRTAPAAGLCRVEAPGRTQPVCLSRVAEDR